MGSFKKSCLKHCYNIEFANFENGGINIQKRIMRAM